MQEETASKLTALLDLEERLLADGDGSLRKELDGYLEVIERDALETLRRMLAPDEHERCRRIADGVAAARVVLATCCGARPAAPGP